MVKEVLGKVRYTAVLDRCQKGLQCRGVNDLDRLVHKVQKSKSMRIQHKRNNFRGLWEKWRMWVGIKDVYIQVVNK